MSASLEAVGVPHELSGDLTIQHAAGLMAELLEYVRSAAEPEFGLAGVSELDTAGLQLLLLARHEAAALGRTLRLTEPSRAVLDVLAIAHLSPDLEPTDPRDPTDPTDPTPLVGAV